MPVEVNRTASPRIEPLTERTGESGPVALVNLRKPDENVGVVEQPAQGSQFFIRCSRRFFSQDHARDVRAGRTDKVLKRRHDRGKDTRIELDQDSLASF